MFEADAVTVPELQPPGMGLPKVELFFARILVAVKLRLTSQAHASEIFVSEMLDIISIIKQIDPVFCSKRVLIDRLPGLEDSSRYWSIYMTLEHLLIVNRFTIGVVSTLLSGKQPQVVVNTASVKPKVGVDDSVVQQFQAICAEFNESFPPSTNLWTSVTLQHPWFGKLNAQQWHFFAGFHMSLHKKQIIKIAEKLS